MNQTASWFLLLIGAIMLVIIGFTGTAGKLFAVAFVPGQLNYLDGPATGNIGPF